MRSRLSEAEIRRRLPVWIAFSDGYLDSETDAVTYGYIARVCRASGYERDDLRRILFEEVGPAFSGNLLQPACIWGMFSDVEVQRAMRTQLFLGMKFQWPHRRWLTAYTAEHWAVIDTWIDRPVAHLEP